ncbi:hypothetical protein L596_001613 [Steinernema carpocapsae]|uniref:FXNA-like protease n=1 Tax=Steinernema carpocapsae TaxID=34508 RepID=A0A4U8UMR1_STECR|nr:hypothetical protein L596_001613 [Steinernema carpocapsae]
MQAIYLTSNIKLCKAAMCKSMLKPMLSNGQTRERRSSKPYQLLGEDPLSTSSEKKRPSSSQLRFLCTPHWICIVALLVVLVFGTQYLHKRVPRPLPPNEENDRFSEIRGRPILQKLSNLGPKPSGSYTCEKLAMDMIIDELESIKTKSEEKENPHTITIEKQYPSGCFDIPRFDTDGFALCYRNVSNIIVRLGQKNRPWHESNTAVLLNCHYDSVPNSLGGSDDLVSCAVMMEILRVMTSPKRSLIKHDVIFLFNGAEESSLLAAHGFITKHPYRHGIKAFINMEASGSGGRELLFQAGPGNQWLLNSYLEAAVHPHCSILGQEVFQSGVYPGDTDFRIFRDYGRVPGLDLAFVQNGYWYHTEFDRAERITPGSMQRAGENVLATLRHLLDSPYLEHPAEYGDQKFVFFDVVGLFTVIYPMGVGEAVNVVSSIIVIVNVIVKVLRFQKGDVIGNYSLGQLGISVASHILTGISIAACVFGLAKLVNSCDMTMTWYVKPWAVVPLYGLSTFLTGVFVQTIFTRFMSHKSDAKFLEHALHDAHLVILSTALLFLTYKGIASAFLLALLVVFPLFRNLVIRVLQKVFQTASPSLYLFAHLISVLPGLVMVIYTFDMLISIFVPIMGRNASNPEFIIATFCAVPSFFAVIAFGSLIPRTKTDSITKIVTLCALIWLATFVVLNEKHMKTSYDYKPEYPTTRRMILMHMRRNTYGKNGELEKRENGILAKAMDFRGVEDIPFVSEPNSGFRPLTSKTNCKYKELPYYYPPAKKEETDKTTRFKPVDEELHSKNPINVTMHEKVYKDDKIIYNFTVSGSGQTNVFITPQSPYNLYQWSLFSSPNQTDTDNSAFAFLHCSGENCGTWDFTVVLQKAGDSKEDVKGHELHLSAVAHYLHGPDMVSKTLQGFLDRIKQERTDPEKWKWAITATSWCTDVIAKYF